MLETDKRSQPRFLFFYNPLFFSFPHSKADVLSL